MSCPSPSAPPIGRRSPPGHTQSLVRIESLTTLATVRSDTTAEKQCPRCTTVIEAVQDASRVVKEREERGRAWGSSRTPPACIRLPPNGNARARRPAAPRPGEWREQRGRAPNGSPQDFTLRPSLRRQSKSALPAFARARARALCRKPPPTEGRCVLRPHFCCRHPLGKGATGAR